MKKTLTEKQKIILNYLALYNKTYGRSASQEEIARNTFVKHQANTRYYLNALARKGYIEFIPYEPRGIKVLMMAEPESLVTEDATKTQAIAVDEIS